MSDNEFNEIIDGTNEEEEIEEWITLTNHPDYEINKQYPHQIKKKSNNYIIKEHKTKQGYINCHLNLRNYPKHRIIAEQFIPNDDPEHLTDIDHINHIRDDNHISNLRWCSKSQNVRNKAAYNGRAVEYLDELPPESIKIELYKGIEFENYFYSKQTQKCYYDNGVKIRTLPYHFAPSGMRYVRALDIENKTRCIYIDAWLRSECIE